MVFRRVREAGIIGHDWGPRGGFTPQTFALIMKDEELPRMRAELIVRDRFMRDDFTAE
jgi:hypothetical protein